MVSDNTVCGITSIRASFLSFYQFGTDGFVLQRTVPKNVRWNRSKSVVWERFRMHSTTGSLPTVLMAHVCYMNDMSSLLRHSKDMRSSQGAFPSFIREADHATPFSPARVARSRKICFLARGPQTSTNDFPYGMGEKVLCHFSLAKMSSSYCVIV